MAHKKGGGSSRNGRDSHGQRLGVKVYGGQTVRTGAVLRSPEEIAADGRQPHSHAPSARMSKHTTGAISISRSFPQQSQQSSRRAAPDPPTR